MQNEPDIEQAAPDTSPAQPRRFRRRLLIVSLVFLPVGWLCLHTPPLRISKETTYVTEPLTPDGKRVDYFGALAQYIHPPEMRTDENGYRLIVRDFGNLVVYGKHAYDARSGYNKFHPADPEPFRLRVYETLGLDPAVPPVRTLVGKDIEPYGYINKHYESLYEKPEDRDKRFEMYDELRRPWTPEVREMMQPWIDDIEPVLDRFAEALRKPAFCMPFVYGDAPRTSEDMSFFPQMQLAREITRGIQARAWYRVGIGDLDGAIDDVMSLHLLARHLGNRGTNGLALVGVAIEGVAWSVAVGGNPEFPLTEKHLRRWLRELDALPPRLDPVEAFKANRYVDLECVQEALGGKTSKWLRERHAFLRSISLGRLVDPNVFMRRTNEIYDDMIDGTFSAEEKTTSRNPLRYLTVRNRTKQLLDLLEYDLITIAAMPFTEAYHRNDCQENMQRLTLALLWHEKEHGTLPEDDWRRAIRPYLGENPDRYFRCASCDPPDGRTSYALLRHESGVIPTTPGVLLLVEVEPAMPLSEGDGRISTAAFREYMRRIGSTNFGRNTPHVASVQGTFRGGAVRVIGITTPPETLETLIDGTASRLP